MSRELSLFFASSLKLSRNSAKIDETFSIYHLKAKIRVICDTGSLEHLEKIWADFFQIFFRLKNRLLKKKIRKKFEKKIEKKFEKKFEKNFKKKISKNV